MRLYMAWYALPSADGWNDPYDDDHEHEGGEAREKLMIHLGCKRRLDTD